MNRGNSPFVEEEIIFTGPRLQHVHSQAPTT
jgi:hypothetical protein